MTVVHAVCILLGGLVIMVVAQWLKRLALMRLNALRDALLCAQSIPELRGLKNELVFTCYDGHWSREVRCKYRYMLRWVEHKLEIESGRSKFGVITDRAGSAG
jgi:hypothetical protein